VTITVNDRAILSPNEGQGAVCEVPASVGQHGCAKTSVPGRRMQGTA